MYGLLNKTFPVCIFLLSFSFASRPLFAVLIFGVYHQQAAKGQQGHHQSCAILLSVVTFVGLL